MIASQRLSSMLMANQYLASVWNIRMLCLHLYVWRK